MLGALRSQAGTTAVPLIFVTSIRDPKAQRTGMRLGADDFLVKPITRTDLLDAIGSRLERADAIASGAARRDAMAAMIRPIGEPHLRNDTVTMLVALTDVARAGNYRVVGKIGEGGMSKVYLAEDSHSGREVVLKILRFEQDARDDLINRFLHEYMLLRRITSPHVAKVFDNGITESCAYLVMEHFGGGTLRARMRQAFPPRRAHAVMRDVAEGVAALHQNGIVHRDLKPENVMVRADGSLAIADLGIATFLGPAPAEEAEEFVTGTPAYMSPEHARGAVVQRQSDVYSLGVMFFEMLEGKRPFSALNIKGLMYQHAVAPVPRLRAENCTYQPLIDAMLAKALSGRPADADAVLAWLDKLDVPAVVAPPASPIPTPAD